MSATMNFGFNNNYEVSADKYLKGGVIHTGIKLTKAGLSKLTGKDNTEYEILEFVFADKDGKTYTERMFAPRSQEDFEKRLNANGKPMPSNWDNINFYVGHIISTFNPKAMENLTGKSFKSFAEYGKIVENALVKQLNNKETNLKLILNKDKYARLPYCVGVNKEGEAFLASKFLGEALEFSPYEIESIERIKNARPTNARVAMPSIGDEVDSSSEDLDLADLANL